MVNLAFSDVEFASEREVVLEERRQRVDNDPGARLAERVDATFFINSNYRRPIIGWEHEIRGLTADDVRHFYRSWYNPANAVLVIAGDVTADAVRPLAERTYGAIAEAPLQERLVLDEPVPLTARTVVLQEARVRQPEWVRHFPAPSYGTGPEESTDALEVLAEILGGGPTSRLYRTLVVDGNKAVSVRAAYDPSRRGPSRLSIIASPREGVAISELEAVVEAEIGRAVREGFGDVEVARGKERLSRQAIYARDALTTGAHILGEALSLGRTIDAVETWPARIEAVTSAQVNAVARAVLDRRRAVTARLLTETGEPPAALQ
jgi:zinc protease